MIGKILCKLGFHKWENDRIQLTTPFKTSLVTVTGHAIWQMKEEPEDCCINFYYCKRCSKTDYKVVSTKWLKELK